MALLKCHAGFRGVQNQSCALLCTTNSSNSDCGCSCRQAGTFSSTISKGASNISNALKRQTSNTQTHHSSNDNVLEKQDGKNLRSKLRSFKVKINNSYKIANVNKYITETSRKIINSGLSIGGRNNLKNGITSRKDSYVDESSAYSLEKTITKMNQSVLSFYDPTYVDETVYKAKFSDPSVHIIPRTEILDDDFANSPREAPSSSRLLAPDSATSLERRKSKAEERRVEKISRLSLESRTKALVQGLAMAFSTMSRLSRMEELSEHLITHPECVWDASKENVMPLLLNLAASRDKNLKGMANQCLSLMGYVKPLKSPGIRILSIDGGGTRGLVPLEFLKALEKETGKRTHELFDYVCGVSTGALMAAIICLYKVSLNECEELYKRFSIKTFTRNRVVGTTKLVWNHGFYDTEVWEEILRKEMGQRPFIEFSRDSNVPKMSVVSAVITPSRMTNHLFRTYNIPAGMKSQYMGHCKHRIWEVIRASSAAPGYFEPFTLGDDVHEDGGILTNNPTALGIHESKLLWEKENFHTVVSLGTGRFETKDGTPAKLSLKRRISTIVDSACDTEAVHHTLQDLLPPNVYYRFNPYLSEEFYLDEIREDKMEVMQHDARLYNRRNKYKIEAVAARLVEKRRPRQIAFDWMKNVASSINKNQ